MDFGVGMPGSKTWLLIRRSWANYLIALQFPHCKIDLITALT